MSLLIKALANAEKDKQAELSKKHSTERAASAASSLELTPMDDRKSEPPQIEEAGVAEKLVADPQVGSNLSLANDTFVDDGLSLAEEAGLVALNVAKHKADKPDAGAAKGKTATPKMQNNGAANAGAGALASAAASHSAPANAAPQKVAANVFVANQPVKSSSSKSALVLLGIAGALMIWLGIEGSRYISELTAPDAVVVRPAPLAPQAVNTSATVESATVEQIEQPSTANQNVAAASVTPPNQVDITKAVAPMETEPVFKVADNSRVVAREEVKKVLTRQPDGIVSGDGVSQQHVLPGNSAKQIPLQLTSRTPVAGVDPILLSAYQAFSRGEDAGAQQQYRQVLQRDVRNVDALLGMAAIAQRQGRDADAAGWYQKVLEIEPRNTIAQSAVAGSQASADAVGTESRIKNLLVQQPEAANLHAALGNLYAEQNQWTSAQDAYFNASRFAPNSADYAFNLAISLDQLGKSSLALAQYQRALDLLNSSGASTPDRVQLEARISALK